MITRNIEQKVESETKMVVIISGATGSLGKEYLKYYSKKPGVVCYGLTRREEKSPIKGVRYLMSNLEDSVATREQIKKINLDKVADVLLIHPVGKFKFESEGIPEVDEIKDGIDDEVFKSNVDTLHNIVRPLIEQRKIYGAFPLKIVAFGSLSDHYHVPWWNSYTKSKLILRQEMRELSKKIPSVKSVFINLCSVKTSNESKTRPYADTKYWLITREVVAKSVQTITNTQRPYLEIDLFNPSPEYHRDYYRNFDELRNKWLREMKGGI